MAFTQFSEDMNKIAALPDDPITDGGLTSQQFKEKFDLGGLAVQTYINGTLLKQAAEKVHTHTTADITDFPEIPTVPTNVSEFTNDAGYVTDAYHDDTKADASDVLKINISTEDPSGTEYDIWFKYEA